MILLWVACGFYAIALIRAGYVAYERVAGYSPGLLEISPEWLHWLSLPFGFVGALFSTRPCLAFLLLGTLALLLRSY